MVYMIKTDINSYQVQKGFYDAIQVIALNLSRSQAIDLVDRLNS